MSEMKPLTIAATKAMRDADNNFVQAVELLTARVWEDEGLRNEVVEPLIETACHGAIRALAQRERQKIWLPPNYDPTGAGERLRSVANASLLDFRLPIEGMPRLAESTKAQLAEAAQYYQKRAVDMAHKERWLLAIAKKVPASKRVADVFDEKKLRALQAKTESDA